MVALDSLAGFIQGIEEDITVTSRNSDGVCTFEITLTFDTTATLALDTLLGTHTLPDNAKRAVAAAAGEAIGERLQVQAMPATELSGFHLEDDMSDWLIVAISQSGTTTDTNRTVDLVRARGDGLWQFAMWTRRARGQGGRRPHQWDLRARG